MAVRKTPSSELSKYFPPAELNQLLREEAENNAEFQKKISLLTTPPLISIDRVNWYLEATDSLAAQIYKKCRENLKRRKLNTKRARYVVAREVTVRRIIGPGERTARQYFDMIRGRYPDRAAEIAILVEQLDDGFQRLRLRWGDAGIELRETDLEREDRQTVGISIENAQEKKHVRRSTRRKYNRERRPDDEWRDAVSFCALIQGLKGMEYCKFLSQKQVHTPSSWWKKAAKEYPEAFKESVYKKRIYQQKNRASKKLERLKREDPKALEEILRRHQAS